MLTRVLHLEGGYHICCPRMWLGGSAVHSRRVNECKNSSMYDCRGLQGLLRTNTSGKELGLAISTMSASLVR